jgi:UDP-3-O-[3-hydroxymyristoyl] N-acetylglucosamine deacetylase
LAALRALEVDNATIEVEGPEIPVMDGSAAAFVEAVDEAGVSVQEAPRRLISVLKPVRVERGLSWAEFLPGSGMRMEIIIDFASGWIGRQSYCGNMSPGRFRREIACARTFGFLSDLEHLRASKLALGASLDNTIVISKEGILNQGGLRWPDEFARHKALDALGDLALAGAPILGLYRSYRGGHALNVQALRAMFADQQAYAIYEPERRTSHALGSATVGVAAHLPELA